MIRLNRIIVYSIFFVAFMSILLTLLFPYILKIAFYSTISSYYSNLTYNDIIKQSVLGNLLNISYSELPPVFTSYICKKIASYNYYLSFKEIYGSLYDKITLDYCANIVGESLKRYLILNNISVSKQLLKKCFLDTVYKYPDKIVNLDYEIMYSCLTYQNEIK